MKAFVFAAGRGERLRPLTEHTPKPLLAVGGRALIDWHLDALARAGVSEAIVNLSYLGERIRARLGDGSGYGLSIRYSDEGPEPLETAGALVHARELIGADPFIAVAADIWCPFDYASLPRQPSGLGHLVLVDNPPEHPDGDFSLTPDGRVGLAAEHRKTFAGIAVYRPQLFAGLAPGPRPLRELLWPAAARGLLSGQHHSGDWVDVGTPERLHAVRRRLG